MPQDIVKRTKQPYIAFDSKSFFGNGTVPDYVEDLLSQRSIKRTDILALNPVERLVNKCRKNLAMGFKDNMALVGHYQCSLWTGCFVKGVRHQVSEGYGLRVAG